MRQFESPQVHAGAALGLDGIGRRLIECTGSGFHDNGNASVFAGVHHGGILPGAASESHADGRRLSGKHTSVKGGKHHGADAFGHRKHHQAGLVAEFQGLASGTFGTHHKGCGIGSGERRRLLRRDGLAHHTALEGGGRIGAHRHEVRRTAGYPSGKDRGGRAGTGHQGKFPDCAAVKDSDLVAFGPEVGVHIGAKDRPGGFAGCAEMNIDEIGVFHSLGRTILSARAEKPGA